MMELYVKGKTKKWVMSVIAVVLSLAVIPSGSFAQSVEDDISSDELYFEYTTESTMEVYYGDDIEARTDANGDVYLHNTQSNEEEVLPATTTDQDGNEVNLNYVIKDESVEVEVINPDAIESMSAWKCVLGTAGGTGTGGLAGAGVGSAVPVIGTGAGAIVGGVSGGLTGAAASCFD
ncbi:hypothetical protein [Alkalicoccobacillus gibsonii]|uniref:hypothetical protein n=1 Tax=Alkalicoccobacillus gibsonii TaxID=79881 RepID=UPI001931EC52|nr:hypothetical protein [Alkalicoccobacillus gibsonii]MBM0067584.1 hypothetical protein [Alkalicoccobacillus gibsonii]